MENQKLEQCLYLDNLSNIKELEQQIMVSFSKKQDMVLEHFNNAKIISRQASESGYYVVLKINTILSKIQFEGFSEPLDLLLNGHLIGVL